MAGNEMGMADQVWSPNRFWSKAQVRDCHRAGFLGVVVEVSLRIIISLFADDLDGVLICAHSTIRAQSKEQAALGGLIFDGEILIKSREEWVTSSLMPTVK